MVGGPFSLRSLDLFGQKPAFPESERDRVIRSVFEGGEVRDRLLRAAKEFTAAQDWDFDDPRLDAFMQGASFAWAVLGEYGPQKKVP